MRQDGRLGEENQRSSLSINNPEPSTQNPETRENPRGFLPETLINDLDQTLNPETWEIPQWGFLPETRIIDQYRNSA